MKNKYKGVMPSYYIMSLFVKGQGVILFKNPNPSIHIKFANSTKTNVLTVEIGDDVRVYCNQKYYTDPNNTSGTVKLPGAYYWISLNAQTQQIYVGIGEPRLETAIYQCYLAADQKPFLESLGLAYGDRDTNIYKVLKDPITRTVPLLVRDTDDLTMEDIAANTYMPRVCLSLTSQRMYECISGKNFVLDDASFPDFSDAIEYSIATPGKWCYEKLKAKSREFNTEPNLKETYLRITLGENSGESPGIPYVMEIWPPGHYSPVHSHAGASAIIRVLHGEIHVKLYPFLCAERDAVDPFGRANFKEGDITWISPTLNQTHQLVNQRNKTCVTIQCYMYESNNTRHYDYFDYLDGNGNKKQYEPDSDMDFVQFKRMMQSEWASR